MAEELSDLGIEHIGSGPDSSPISADPTELLAISKTMATDVQAVLLGYDVHFSYTKQFKAASYLLNKVGIFTMLDLVGSYHTTLYIFVFVSSVIVS